MTKNNIIIGLFLIIINGILSNGIYKIKYQDLYLNFYHKHNKFYFSRNTSLSRSSLFRIYNEFGNNTSDYLIESLKHNKKLFSSHNKVLSDTKYEKSDKNFFWSFIIIKVQLLSKIKMVVIFKFQALMKLHALTLSKRQANFIY